ncbi:MAG: class I SAM-dependent methyltransferase [Candidatus Eisenbacteria bacterium]|nr:class I SAM-dependent methyltransferase [Candidatus Eisenbacteria bacterium]
MRGFDRGMRELLEQAGPVASVLEVGCGEGHVTEKLARFFPHAQVTGTDSSPEIVEVAKRSHPDLRFEQRSVYDLTRSGEHWDLVVACEVFEHLDDPRGALREIAAVAGAMLVTVPREPLWRILNVARGKYLARLGNSHGHVQNWNRGRFLDLLREQVEVVDWRSPLPWTQALCRPRAGSRT